MFDVSLRRCKHQTLLKKLNFFPSLQRLNTTNFQIFSLNNA